MKHSILMVDDDKLILNTLQKHFGTWDMETYAVTNIEEAKKVMEKIVPDVVLLDLLLSGEDDSANLLDYMKSRGRLASVPVIILTNLDKPELKQTLLERGVKEYLIKGSMTLDDIYDKVVQYLEPQGEKS